MVEDEVVDALVAAVVADYPRLSHRYYALKAKWLGLDKLQHWDRNAPLPDDDDARYRLAGGEASACWRAYGGFSPELAEIAGRFFDRAAGSTPSCAPGKAGGAFAHPTVPSAHPYLLLNYHGRTRDVMTLAHELGHGVHQVLAADQGYLLAGTPLTLAETASVFGEMLTFRALLDAETDPAAPAHHARRQGRGHAEHGGAADRLLPLRDAAARRAAHGRAGAGPHRRDLADRCSAKASARPSSSRRNTACSGPTCRTSSTRRSTSTRMRSATAW